MKYSFFLKEPYRIFFPLAAASGIIGAGLWYFYSAGILPYYSGFLHACIQMQICMGCFIAGFLMTAIPRMSASKAASGFELLTQLLATLTALTAYSFNYPRIGHIAYIIWLLLLGRFLFIRFSMRSADIRSSSPAVEFIWVPAGLLLGLISAAAYLISPYFSVVGYFARQTVNQGLILCVTAGVGSFMGARLTGRMRVRKTQKPADISNAELLAGKRYRKIVFQVAGIFLFYISFILEGMHRDQPAYLIRAAVMTYCFLDAGVLPRWPRVKDLYAWFLWLSFWMVILGLWGCPVHLMYRKSSLHVSFLGGLGLMTYMVATMVILSHAGESEKLRKSLPVFWLCFFGVMSSLGFRVAAVLWPDYFFKFIAAASAIWVMTAILWLLFMMRYFFRVPDPHQFQEQHEKDIKRVREC